MITGDNLRIAMETARVLELGDRIEGRDGVIPQIRNAEGLPMLDPVTKKAPENMAKIYGEYIRDGHGFAQVGCWVAGLLHRWLSNEVAQQGVDEWWGVCSSS